MNYKPLGSRVLVKVLTKTEIKIAGQTLTIARGVNKYGKAPKEFEEEVLSCEVIKVGDSVTDLSSGDVVIIPGYAGKWVDTDLVDSPHTHRIVDEADVIAIDVEATEKSKQGELQHA